MGSDFGSGTDGTMMNAYQPPVYLADSFNCPWCGVRAQQHWITLLRRTPVGQLMGTEANISTCHVCGKESLWYEEELLIPSGQSFPLPHPDLPAPLQDDYLEARDIAQRSPRAAGALLRLIIERLCPLVGGEGRNLHACIGNLVAKGLKSEVQEMLDTVRVTGNDLVHGGTFADEDTEITVSTLFWLVNEITDEMITRPRRIKEAYARLTPDQKAGIEQRDKKVPGPSG
jgi:hypothetical protein